MPKTSVLVDFKVSFDTDEMPSSYSNPEYLQDVVTEAVEDAMNDIGSVEVEDLNVWVEEEDR